MNQAEREILHHHAAAIDWLCGQLSEQYGDPPEQWRSAAFSYALEQWRLQAPAEMKATLDRNLDALQRMIAEEDNQ